MKHESVSVIGGGLAGLVLPKAVQTPAHGKIAVLDGVLGVYQTDPESPSGLTRFVEVENMVTRLFHMGTFTFQAANPGSTSLPTLAQQVNMYKGAHPWTENPTLFWVENGVQHIRVPSTGTYRIRACGAGQSARARGYSVTIEAHLEMEDILQVVVGGTGTYRSGSGGTFVTVKGQRTLAVAGGAGCHSTRANHVKTAHATSRLIRSSAKGSSGFTISASGGRVASGGGYLSHPTDLVACMRGNLAPLYVDGSYNDHTSSRSRYIGGGGDANHQWSITGETTWTGYGGGGGYNGGAASSASSLYADRLDAASFGGDSMAHPDVDVIEHGLNSYIDSSSRYGYVEIRKV